MKKNFTFFKMLLVAVGLCVGSSAWAQKTVVYGRAVTADAENGYTAWSASDIGTGKWVASKGTASIDTDGKGLKVAQQRGSALATNSSQIAVSEDVILTIDAVWNTGYADGGAGENNAFTIGNNIEIRAYTYDQHGNIYINGSEYATISNACGKDNGNRSFDPWTIHIEINTATNKITAFTIRGENGTKKATYTLDGKISLASNTTYNSLTLAHNRTKGNNAAEACYLTSVLVTEEEYTPEPVGYTINYKDGENIVKTVNSTGYVGSTILAETVINGTEEGYVGTHYLAVANETPSMELEDNAASNVLNVPVRLPYTATLNVTYNFDGSTIDPISSNWTETDTKDNHWKYAYPLYVKYNGVYYKAAVTSSFGETGTFNDGDVINKTVNYSNPESDIVVFSDFDNANYKEEDLSLSNGNRGGYNSSGSFSTTLDAGNYEILVKVVKSRHSKSGSFRGFSMSLGGAEFANTVGEYVGDYTTTINVASDGQEFKLYKGYNETDFMDYIIIRKLPATVSKSITNAGWATLYTDYALDFSNAIDNLDAVYIVTGGANGILTKTEVTGTVPANTGLLLKGSEGTVTIPVVASSTTDVSANKLVGVTADTQIDANAGYVLMNDATNGLAFYQNANAFTVGANTAYLPANFYSNGAKARFFSLVDENATAINGVESKKAENGVMYNLAGQRVGKDYKGIVIVNGKKVMNK